mmetsp:Transcript_10994/g.16188  ORF Transcript_10994/g.16188 Transcript_10994/m.16188 type:complete len:345 (+) Transcript_10994:828-1862(+)|eukprot:CAMPEP_0117418198 /NCGR_PEP_ID=MMETSP0758-20121206/35_1 /TAXON_ID=63605 /ORGANISM="Percolomonas cosmopolitus, Strain AE-1 (ATCC 50343)" /LENGTH=344 /DNA_ID=CAMNT_0005198573 /DNA_START=6 /DNA_END=1040 /DNA_ORIENTATION=+
MDKVLMKDYVVEAISVAKQAVKADQCNPIQAHSIYRECAARFRHIIPHVPDEHKVVFDKFAKAYEERADTLREQLTQHEGEMIQRVVSHQRDGSGDKMTISGPSSALLKKEDTPYELDELTGNKINDLKNNPYHQIEQPAQWLKKPFWLMRKLNQSMNMGCHMSETLFIPAAVWQQNLSQKLSNVTAKVEFIDHLCNSLEPIDELANHSLQEQDTLTTIESELLKINSEFKEHRNQLEKTISSKSKKSFKLARMFSSSKKSEVDMTQAKSGQQYTENLIKLFKRCQTMSRWLDHFETTPHKGINAQLEAMSIFLCMQVCQFVLQDLNILLLAYMRTAKENYVKA